MYILMESEFRWRHCITKPHILVTLRDDNPYLPINDAKLFELKLDTGRNQFITIPIPSDEIQFKAATGASKAELTIPNIERWGLYTFSSSKRCHGKFVGSNPQMVQFRVIEKQSVSNVLNYPNPFSTSTQFIFTLTGEQGTGIHVHLHHDHDRESSA